MNLNWKGMKPRNILTVLAEIATIVSLILAWIMYQDSKNISENAFKASPILIFFIAVNAVMFLFLSLNIVRTVMIQVNRKSFLLNKKFESFLESGSKYISELKRSNIKDRQGAKKDYNKLINATRKAIKSLDDNVAFDEDVYYMILYSLFYGASGNINVVSILDDNEWVDTPEEDEFLQVNMGIKDRKIHLNRIFVVDENEIAVKINNKSIQSFIEADHTYVHLFVVFRDRLSRSLINDIGSGFIEFYNFAVACDRFTDNEIRGTLKLGAKEIESYNKIYMQLTGFYQPLNNEFINRYFPTPTQTSEDVNRQNCCEKG